MCLKTKRCVGHSVGRGIDHRGGGKISRQKNDGKKSRLHDRLGRRRGAAAADDEPVVKLTATEFRQTRITDNARENRCHKAHGPARKK